MMRLYLSSFRIGDHPELLVTLAGEGARLAVIANAMDDAPEDVRREGVDQELLALIDLGFRTAEVDLRDYFGSGSALGEALAGYDGLWVRGGNVFVLRDALKRSGADAFITDALAQDAFVYAGYSAGPCVLAPTLRGLETVDDATAVTRLYGSDPVWEGLGVLEYAVVPHCQSPDHPESTACDAVAEAYRIAGVPHRTLRDGQVLLVNGQSVTLH